MSQSSSSRLNVVIVGGIALGHAIRYAYYVFAPAQPKRRNSSSASSQVAYPTVNARQGVTLRQLLLRRIGNRQSDHEQPSGESIRLYRH